jgi:hypothetical protein
MKMPKEFKEMERARQEFENKIADHCSGPQISPCHAFCSVVEARGFDRIQLDAAHGIHHKDGSVSEIWTIFAS